MKTNILIDGLESIDGCINLERNSFIPVLGGLC